MAATALRLLQEAGATEMRVRYDGGSDEGFAHADDVWIDGESKSPGEVLDLLLKPESPRRIREAASAPRGSYWHEASEHYGQNEPRRVISDAMEELAHEIASQLLGEGYGTGEYELYGALIVNFQTGEILDDPAAQPPT